MNRETWDKRYAAVDLVWGKEPNRFLEAELRDCEVGGRALDLACGEGRNAIWLAGRGWQVTAVDFSTVAIERARRLASEAGVDVEWIVDDVVTWRAQKGTFELVVVLYYQVSPAYRIRTLRSAVASLSPGGELLMIGHARRNLSDGVGGPMDPTLLWEPEELAAEVEEAGASVFLAEHRRRPVQGEDGTQDAIDTILRGRVGSIREDVKHQELF